LRFMAERSWEECEGWPYSPAQAQCLEYCGLQPRGVRSPGSSAMSTDRER
jgi:hypothetical protein